MRFFQYRLSAAIILAFLFTFSISMQPMPDQAGVSGNINFNSSSALSDSMTSDYISESEAESDISSNAQLEMQTSDIINSSIASSDSKRPSVSSTTKPSVSSSHRPGTSLTGRPSKPSSNQNSSSSSSKPTIPSSPSPSPAPTPAGKIVVGYYTGYSAYKGYTPQKVPVSKLTHLNYAFAKIEAKTGKIALADPANDRKNFAALRTLKQNNKHLKTLISIGGWDYSTYFSDVASTQTRRELFAQSCLDFILEHGFDGIDLDWEYPVSGGLAGTIHRPQDKQNFTLLLQAIREKLNAQEKKDGKKYYLTIAGAPGNDYLSKIEPKNIASLVDYIFLMTYDLHGPWDRYADLNAPLYQPTENSPQYKSSVYDGVKSYLSSGVSSKKLVLGMPFYGYLYQGVSSQNNGLYSKFSSAKSISYDSIRKSYLNDASYLKLRHNVAQVPYLYGKNAFITYEDTQSIAAKVKLAKSMGLAGVGIWELSHDTSGALLNSTYQTLHSRSMVKSPFSALRNVATKQMIRTADLFLGDKMKLKNRILF